MNDIPDFNNQQFSEKTLRGYLLKNVDPRATNPTIKQLNEYLIQRVNLFWDDVVVPLQRMERFDGNKIMWYFEVYKEGHEAKKLQKTPFLFINIQEEQIKEIVKCYSNKTLEQYLEFGTSFLSNTFSLLSLWVRDKLILYRTEHIYSSDMPIDWILRAEDEEHGAMSKKIDTIDGLMDVINNISIIMSRRV